MAPLVYYRAARMAKRLVPVAAEAWRRWQALPPEQKERYKKQARGYAERGRDISRDAYARARRRRRS